jgi:DNA-binding winged helix-turn-helix (wHTH) protein
MNEQSYYLIDDNIEFHFEPQDMKLKRGDKTIKLRPMEVKTLLCILNKTGQYMTRAQIANGIWQNVPSHDIQNKSAQATKYISIIRKQLAKIDIDESWLITEEHLGYKVSCAVQLISVETQQKQQQQQQKAIGEAQKNHVRRDTRIKILVNTIVRFL